MSEKPEGLYFFENAVKEEFGKLVEKWFFTEEIQKELFSITKSSNSRKVIHYGYRYDYNSGGINEKAPDFPYIISILRNSIKNIWKDSPENLENSLNQCIINRYLPGQGIGPHIDRTKYGGIIVCFTFLSGREMKFTKGDEIYKIYIPKYSVYIMTDEARYSWKHQMEPRIRDGNLPRKECFSITFREVPE